VEELDVEFRNVDVVSREFVSVVPPDSEDEERETVEEEVDVAVCTPRIGHCQIV
jgi:hypothetical protein